MQSIPCFSTKFLVLHFFLSSTWIYSQAILKPINCTDLQASFSPIDKISSRSNQDRYTFVLEEAIQPNLWTKIQTKVTTASEVHFREVLPATYRVSVISPGASKIIFQSNIAILDSLDCEVSTKAQQAYRPPEQGQQVQVYPLPAQDQLYLRWPESLAVHRVSLYHFTGQALQQWSVRGQAMEMDVRELASGVYLLLFEDSQTVLATHKISILR